MDDVWLEELKAVRQILTRLKKHELTEVGLQQRWDILDVLRQVAVLSQEIEATFLFARGHDLP